MSWAEFRIRLFAFKRQRQYELELLRVHAYHTATGGIYAFDPSKFPKTIDKFWNIGSINTKTDIEAQKKRLEFLRQKQAEANKSNKKK